MRPRWVYFSTFIWISVCTGRFLSLFLQHEAKLDDFQIGLTLSMQASSCIVFCMYFTYEKCLSVGWISNSFDVRRLYQHCSRRMGEELLTSMDTLR